MGKMGRPTDHEAAFDHGLQLVERFESSDLVKHVLIAGSVRRMVPVVSDLDILIELEDDQPFDVLGLHFPEFHWTPSSGEWDDGKIRVEIYRAPPMCAGATLQFLTGPGSLNVYLRMKAKQRGWRLSQYGIQEVHADQTIRIDEPTDDPWVDEQQIFELLGLQYMSPEERSDWRESKKKVG